MTLTLIMERVTPLKHFKHNMASGLASMFNGNPEKPVRIVSHPGRSRNDTGVHRLPRCSIQREWIPMTSSGKIMVCNLRVEETLLRRGSWEIVGCQRFPLEIARTGEITSMSQKTYNKAQCLKLLKVDAKTFDRG